MTWRVLALTELLPSSTRSPSVLRTVRPPTSAEMLSLKLADTIWGAVGTDWPSAGVVDTSEACAEATPVPAASTATRAARTTPSRAARRATAGFGGEVSGIWVVISGGGRVSPGGTGARSGPGLVQRSDGAGAAPGSGPRGVRWRRGSGPG